MQMTLYIDFATSSLDTLLNQLIFFIDFWVSVYIKSVNDSFPNLYFSYIFLLSDYQQS